MPEIRAAAAAALVAESESLVARWDRQATSIALRERGAHEGRIESARALVASLAASLESEGGGSEDDVSVGLTFGADAFESGASLHHMLRSLDLLTAMCLYVVETSLAGETGQALGTAADGVRLSRRVQQASALMVLAAARGYTQAVSDGMRDRFRHLRHDLRNPLGTIKSVLALMDDETTLVDARTHPRFLAMAERNARSLDELIMARLSDAAATMSDSPRQSVSLRTIACNVRRDLRAETEQREVSVSIASTRVRVRVDAVSLELLLRAVLQAALHEARPGDDLAISFGEASGRVQLHLACEPSRVPLADAGVVKRLTALASRMRATLQIGEDVVLTMPLLRDERGAAAGSTGASAAHDVPVATAPSSRADG